MLYLFYHYYVVNKDFHFRFKNMFKYKHGLLSDHSRCQPNTPSHRRCCQPL